MFHHFSFTDCADALARHHARLSLAELPPLLAWCREQPGVEFATVGDVAARHRALLADGRLEEASERWRLVYRGPGASGGRLARLLHRWSPRGLVRRAAPRICPPRALLEPGGWARGNRWLRRLGCGEPKPTNR
jgi:hypothetical protein